MAKYQNCHHILEWAYGMLNDLFWVCAWLFFFSSTISKGSFTSEKIQKTLFFFSQQQESQEGEGGKNEKLRKYKLYFLYCLSLYDYLVTGSVSRCTTSSKYSQTIPLVTHSCHLFMAWPIMAVHQYDCVLNIAQCHQFPIYSLSRLCFRNVLLGSIWTSGKMWKKANLAP